MVGDTQSLGDCLDKLSVAGAETFLNKGGKTAGSLGVIGPVRLDYAKIIPYIDYFTEKLTRFLTEHGEGKDDDNEG